MLLHCVLWSAFGKYLDPQWFVCLFFCAGRGSVFGISPEYKGVSTKIFKKILLGVGLLGDSSPMRWSWLELGHDKHPQQTGANIDKMKHYFRLFHQLLDDSKLNLHPFIFRKVGPS